MIMGVETNTIAQCFISADGKTIPFNDIPEVTIDANDNQETIGRITNPASFSVTLKTTYPKWSRKKFVNYIEKMGYSRKYAKKISRIMNRSKIPYGRAYFCIMWAGGETYLKTLQIHR